MRLFNVFWLINADTVSSISSFLVYLITFIYMCIQQQYWVLSTTSTAIHDCKAPSLQLKSNKRSPMLIVLLAASIIRRIYRVAASKNTNIQTTLVWEQEPHTIQSIPFPPFTNPSII